MVKRSEAIIGVGKARHRQAQTAPLGQRRVASIWVGIEVNLSVSQRGREFATAVRGAAFGQLVGKILGMVGGHPGGRTGTPHCQIQCDLTRETQDRHITY